MLFSDGAVIFSSFIITAGKTAYVGTDPDRPVGVMVGACGKPFLLASIL